MVPPYGPASVAAMATKNNGRDGAVDGKQPLVNRSGQKAISIRNLEEASPKPGLSNKRLDWGGLATLAQSNLIH